MTISQAEYASKLGHIQSKNGLGELQAGMNRFGGSVTNGVEIQNSSFSWVDLMMPCEKYAEGLVFCGAKKIQELTGAHSLEDIICCGSCASRRR